MQTRNELAVLIVGAGPTGLTLAIELARRNVSFRLIDAAAGPFNGSRGKGTQPRSLEIFDDLGIVDSVIANGRFNMPMRLYGENGAYRDQTAHAVTAPQPDMPYPVTLMIPQWRVEGLLREKLEQLGGTVEFGVSLESLVQDQDGVMAVLSDGGSRQTCRSRWLVGCDGGKSVTRHQLGMPFIGETMEIHRMMVGDVKVTGLDREFWHIWRNARGFAALAPLPGTDRYQFQGQVSEDGPTEPSLALFQNILDAATGGRDITLSEPGWMSFWRANVRMVEHYRVGAVFLAGDAAHVHTPAGGQGMNTGIQDAYNLGWKLAAVAQGADAVLLDSYEAERLPVAARLLGLSTALYEKIVAGPGFQQQRDGETLQLGIHYRGSPIVAGQRQPFARLQAGDRAPDAPGLVGPQGTCRLFDVLRGTHFTLLSFGNGFRNPVAQAERVYGAKLKSVAFAGATWIDSGAHACNAYGIERDTLLVIRPDGYIGMIMDDCADSLNEKVLLDYLARFIAN